MSTHVRLILQQGGRFYAGPQVVKCLSDYLPRSAMPHTTEQIIEAVAKLRTEGFKITLWLLREPRCLPLAKSRYKQLCKRYMMRKRANQGADPLGGAIANMQELLQHQIQVPPPPQPVPANYWIGVAHGQHNPQGQAAAPRRANHPNHQ